ncbi:type VII secretion protein EccB [Streptomyces physcomitrii]|uniref:type VII secretion protein EccB n=1 Tax=Streptomyces physcomitrii TaxID=2724184 RepID=UPI0034389B94
MASRRDELNAYTFAKRRTLAAFLRPSPSGSEEGAPRPLRGFLPGTVVGVVILAVFGAIGMFSPTAPEGWDRTQAHLIVASDSTTRYVVLDTDGQKQLHPVLNTASAKLLLKDYTDEVVTVDEEVLDNGRIPHGATIGIPYAPDRLPSAEEAETAKRWMVCERPGTGGRAGQKAAFVLAGKEWAKAEGRNRLTGGQLMYVADQATKKQFVIDASGTAYPLADPAQEGLLSALDTRGRAPQRVSPDWLKTFHRGSAVSIPKVPGEPGEPAGALIGDGNDRYDQVGRVLKALDGTRMNYYVVLKGEVGRISEFTARLLLRSPQLADVNRDELAARVNGAVVDDSTPFAGQGGKWPSRAPETVNNGSGTGRDTVCNTLRAMDGSGTELSTWAGTDFPATLPTGSASAYATPGSGQVFRQIKGTDTKSGGIFLVTDTGLRYALQSNADGSGPDQGIGKSKSECTVGHRDDKCAQKLLGYDALTPALIPDTWAEFLPKGPRLSQADARQPQSS